MTKSEACNKADENAKLYQNDDWYVIKHNYEFEVVKLSYFYAHKTESYYKGKKVNGND